ncbi:hypothetical protein C8D88_103357 [Lentzea atacamensis]|uniref:Uncharacterized protein n=1 Tax=Lentzea atacamensis TaxID=531938 RepID=A0A316I3W1_9PSEU|nr:hypothetical protein [Lentzea atacamensis]PWK88161.1 hypothetical protein C8D88_103357 [Lentzea atacamensis]
MSSRTPSGNSSSTASQFSSTPPADSVTWWSSHTCGVCDTPRTCWSNKVLGCSTPTPRALVNTTGMPSGSDRMTRAAETPRWSMACQSRSCANFARSSQVSPSPHATSSNDVKSPIALVMSG